MVYARPKHRDIYMNKCGRFLTCTRSAAQVVLSTVTLFCIPAWAGSQGSTADQLTGKLVITGSSTVAPLIAEMGKQFERLHPAVRIDVQTGGSSRGIADARQGLADIGMVSRAMKDEERDLQAFPVARDGVCIILHKENRISALTDEQILAIYTGKITNWKAVDGMDAPITVVNKADGRSTLEVFLHYFKLKPSEVKAHVVIGDNEQGVKTVAGNRNSIGYVSIGTAEYDATHGVPIKLLPIGEVPASTESVRTGIFPLSRPLHLVTKTAPSGLAKAFIDYAQSKAVHDLIRQQYFVPLAD
jgi:phosphate transport system substrate-binding protein